MTTDLFTPTHVGPLALPNRVVMAPMTRNRATADHTPTDIMAPYYAARADAGLLITEGVAPSPDGCGYPRIPGIWSEAQVAAWRPVAAAVHAAGGRIAMQMMHTGRISHPLNMPPGTRVLGPSAEAAPGQIHTDQEGARPHATAVAMSEADLAETIAAFAQAARNARAAGFDAIELHGANGYLLDQFLTPAVNTRTDAWGGDAAGRRRLVVAVAKAAADAIGADRVGIRLSPFGVFNGITPWESLAEDFTALAGELGKLGLAWIHLVDHSAMGAPPVPEALKLAIAAAFGGTIIRSGGYDRARADADLAAGTASLVAFGRPYLANPDLVTRLRQGAPLNPPDFGTFYTPGEKGYLDYPTLSE